ncbi:MAG: hypothetical protein AVDCRST_MAG66-4422, partial [uncultured Pseudonocardia sp.]
AGGIDDPDGRGGERVLVRRGGGSRVDRLPQFPSAVELGRAAGSDREPVDRQPVDESGRHRDALHRLAV